MQWFNILQSFHHKKKKKKTRLKLYLITLYLSVTGVIQVREEYWLHYKTRDKFLKTYFLRASL